MAYARQGKSKLTSGTPYTEFQINKLTQELDKIINQGNETAGQAKGRSTHKGINYI